MSTFFIALAGGIFVVMTGMNLFVRMQARKMRGRPVPAVSGALGDRLRHGGRALLYFHSPSCGACRAITPRVEQLASRSPAVTVVNVAERLDLARSFKVMATPSFVEVADGKVVALYVGAPPADLLARFA
jgi:thioredoxin 1